MKYRVHRFDMNTTGDQGNLQRLLNSLEGEVISIAPSVTWGFFWLYRESFVLVVEKVG